MTPEEAKRNEILKVLAFEVNPIYDALVMLLDAQIEIENLQAVSRGLKGEDRIHACGGVDSLIGFRLHLDGLREEARRKV